uniref:PAP-associated domain-containing protein n=1 Tax=Trichuris muris TaxID=70415 RepID=A0A5S6R102_TRIMR
MIGAKHEQALIEATVLSSTKSYSADHSADSKIQRLAFRHFKRSRTTLKKLNERIKLYYDAHALTSEEIQQRNSATRLLENCLNFNVKDGAYLFITGSTASGCANRESDLDLCILECVTYDYGYIVTRERQLDFLTQIKQLLLEDQSPVQGVTLIPAHVPIIRCQFKNNPSLTADITFGLVGSVYSTHLLFHYCQLDRRYVILNLLIKQWATKCGVCNSALGMLNSHSIALMVINYLQCGTDPHHPVFPSLQQEFPFAFTTSNPANQLSDITEQFAGMTTSNSQNVADLLLGFFRYYSEVVNFSNQIISVRLGRRITRDHGEHIFVEDPFRRDNAASITSDAAVVYIKARFKDAFEDLLFRQRFEIL